MIGIKVVLEIHRELVLFKSLIKKKDLGVTYNELMLLVVLNGGSTQVKEICVKTLLDKGTIVRTLDKLISKGHVRKVEEPSSTYIISTIGREVIGLVEKEYK